MTLENWQQINALTSLLANAFCDT